MVHRSRFHDSWNSRNFVDIEDVVFGTPLVRVNGPGMDRAVPLSPSPPLYRFVSRVQSFKDIKEDRWWRWRRRRGGVQRACESKRGGKFRRECIKQLLVGSFSRGGHGGNRTKKRRGFHLRYETASGSSPLPSVTLRGNGFRFLSLSA